MTWHQVANAIVRSMTFDDRWSRNDVSATLSISRVLALGAAVAVGASCAGPTIDGTSPVAPTLSPHVATATVIPATSAAELGPVPLPNDVPTPPGQYVLSADARYGIPPLQISFTLTRDGWESWGPGAVTIDSPEASRS